MAYTPVNWQDGVTPLNKATFDQLQSGVIAAERTENKAVANGYPSLDSGGKVPLAQLPPVGADLVYDGAYPAGTPYTDGEIVIYNGVAYMCVRPTSAAPTPWPQGLPYTASYGTTLPASPFNGQEAILVDSVTNPSYQWRFRYNAGSSSVYKWEFVGGAPWEALIGTNEAVTSGAYTDMATPGPSITIPRAGDYFIEVTAMAIQMSATASSNLGTQATGTGVIAVTYLNGASGYVSTVTAFGRVNGISAGFVSKMQYSSGGGVTVNFQTRRQAVTPIRVA